MTVHVFENHNLDLLPIAWNDIKILFQCIPLCLLKIEMFPVSLWNLLRLFLRKWHAGC